MAFTVPNSADVPYVDQSEVDSVDFQILGNRSTGVTSGGMVAAQTMPTMSVQVSEGAGVIAGEVVNWTPISVVVQASSSVPRFDLVAVGTDGIPFVIRGTASSNPTFPFVNTNEFLVLAAIYVRAGGVSVAQSDVVLKGVRMETSMKRSYASDSTVVVGAQSPSGSFSIEADGTHKWGLSTLRRTAMSAMEFMTSLTLRASESANSLLTLKARSMSPADQNVLEVRTHGGALLSSVSGIGILETTNFRRGEGSPLGYMPARKGDIYVDITSSDPNGMLWISTANNSADGWRPLRAFSTNDVELPVGMLVPFLGTTAPSGWIVPQGQPISTIDPETAQLAALIGGRYGTGPNTVYLPDLRGTAFVGVGGSLGLGLGEFSGSPTTTLNVANLPPHTHAVNDPGHVHPKWGRTLTYSAEHSAHPAGDPGWSVVPEPANFNAAASTGITINTAGQGVPISVVQPSHAGNWLCKL